jgi:hypothetical protein
LSCRGGIALVAEGEDESMESTIYTDGTYLRNNPDWHSDDSPWKAAHVARMLERHGIAPATVCEGRLRRRRDPEEPRRHLEPGTRFFGYEISPDAYRLCARKNGGNFAFKLANLLEEPAHFDVVMAMDVFEHVEDCFTFLRKLRGKGRHKIFHIPLDLSAMSLAAAGSSSTCAAPWATSTTSARRPRSRSSRTRATR